MMVLDASALAKYVLREDGWTKVREKLEEETLSIDHVVKEVASAIWRKAIVLRLEPLDAALKRFQVLMRLVKEGVIRLESELKYIDMAFGIAVKEGITVYDALYIAQAKTLGARLITSDREQARVAEKLGVKVYYIA